LKTGIALLGTGGAGAFSIGVLKALEELSIPPQMIAASGSAAFPAVLYASGCSTEELLPLYTYYCERAGRKSWWRMLWDGLTRRDPLKKYIEGQLSGLGAGTVLNVPMPLALMTTDLISGQEILTAPLEESRSDGLQIIPELPLCEILSACAGRMRTIETGAKRMKLIPLGTGRANACWALRRMGAQKVLGVRQWSGQETPEKEQKTLSQALALARQAQGRLERMTPAREDAVLFLPDRLPLDDVSRAAQCGYRMTMEQQQMLYQTLLFEQE
jgi:hypothetical protein